MNLTTLEIESQPDVWRTALGLLEDATGMLARPGERVLVIGCGTSAFVAESFALLREQAGLGETDAAYASEPRPWRPYDAVIGITRSGTTTEVIDALREVPGLVGVEAAPERGAHGELLGERELDELSLIHI